MSNFDDLQRKHSDALTDLLAILDIAAGREDVREQLDRAQNLGIIGDLLDLKGGAAAALAAADNQYSESKDNSNSTLSPEDEGFRVGEPHATLDHPGAQQANRDLTLSPRQVSEEAVKPILEEFSRLAALVRDVRADPTESENWAMWGALLTNFEKLWDGLRRRLISLREANASITSAVDELTHLQSRVTESRRLLVRIILERTLELEGAVQRLFKPSSAFEHTSFDR